MQDQTLSHVHRLQGNNLLTESTPSSPLWPPPRSRGLPETPRIRYPGLSGRRARTVMTSCSGTVVLRVWRFCSGACEVPRPAGLKAEVRFPWPSKERPSNCTFTFNGTSSLIFKISIFPKMNTELQTEEEQQLRPTAAGAASTAWRSRYVIYGHHSFLRRTS